MNHRIKINTWDGAQFFLYLSTMFLCFLWLLITWLRAFLARRYPSDITWYVNWIQTTFEVTHLFAAYLIWGTFAICLYKAYTNQKYKIVTALVVIALPLNYWAMANSFIAEQYVPYGSNLIDKFLIKFRF